MERFKKFTIHLLLLLSIVATSSLAHAQEKLILPSLLKHEGLSFTVPLPKGLTLESNPIVASSGSVLEFIPKIDTPPVEVSESASIIASSAPLLTSTPILPSTPAPSPTVAPTIAPTAIPTPTPVKPGPTTVPISVAPATGSNTTSGGLNADVLFSMSNNYRASKGLAPFQTEARVCTLAAQRAPEIGAEIAEGHMHSGKNSHNAGFAFTENIISFNSEAAAFNWWVNDYIHRVQIEAANKYSCVACSGNNCTQEFSNL